MSSAGTLPGRAWAAVRFRVGARVDRGRSRRLTATLGSVGRHVRLAPDLSITGGDRCRIEDNVQVGAGGFIRAEGGLFIGANTHISRNLVLYTMDHDYQGEVLPYDATQVAGPVHIGRNVWIGMNVCIAPGTTIGDGAIVGMGTVVFGEVPALSIIGSQRWRVIGERDADHYARLEAEGRYGGSGGRPLPR